MLGWFLFLKNDEEEKHLQETVEKMISDGEKRADELEATNAEEAQKIRRSIKILQVRSSDAKAPFTVCLQIFLCFRCRPNGSQ